jgi:UDP-N-acetylglucosamine 2-epimerase (non-hydrolysing)
LTVRPNTERPITITTGTNNLIGMDLPRLESEIVAILDGDAKQGSLPDLRDGRPRSASSKS